MGPAEWMAEIRRRLGMPPRAATWWADLSPGERRMLVMAAGLPVERARAEWTALTGAERRAVREAVARAAAWARGLLRALERAEEASA